MSVTLGVAVLALVLAAPLCGGGDVPEREPDLIMADFAFQPAQLSAVAGKDNSYIVRNTGDAAHNITIEGLDVDVDFEPGVANFVDVAPEGPGDFAFFCTFHPDQMVGQLTVE